MFFSPKRPSKAWPCLWTLRKLRGSKRRKGGGKETEEKGKKGSVSHLGEVRRKEPVGKKEIGALGGEGGGSLTTTLSLLCLPSGRRTSKVLQDTLQQPCTGFKLKTENLLMTVRLCFLGGLSAEGREGESCSRISVKTLDSVTSLPNQKGNTLGSRGQQLRDLLTPLRSREKSPALPALEQTSQPPSLGSGHEKNTLEDTGILKMNIPIKIGFSLLLILFLE